MKNLSIRSRLTLLLIVSALPALGLGIYSGLERRAQAEASAREDLQRLAALAAKQQEETVEGVRQLLFAVAGGAEALKKDPKTCQELFKRLVDGSGGLYHSMGMHGPQGNLVCDAAGGEGAVNVNDRRYFRLAADARRFSVSEYQVGDDTGRGEIIFGYPAADGERKLLGVVFAGMNLEKLNELTGRTPLSAGGRLAVLDYGGTLIARQPDAVGGVGERVRNSRVIEALRAAQDDLFEAIDTDGVRRLFAVRPVGVNPDSSVPLHVVLSIPKQIVLADANKALLQTVVGILMVTALLVVGAWYGAEVAVVSRLRAMGSVAHRIGKGDLTARAALLQGEDEFTELENALDEMAQALQKRDAELKRALRELSEQVITDPLTGLNNRRYLWDFLRRDLLRARRAVLPVAAILFDLDHFKRFNDTWGHEAGDLVLKAAAEVVKQNVRGSDIACRYGGEEFVVILPDATLPVAIERAGKIRRGIERMEFTGSSKPLERITASFGIALFPTHAGNEEALLRAADEALYLAKEGGRNRVEIYAGKPSPL